MARIADLADKLTRRKGLLAARAVLFPELGNEPVASLAEGVLRAPPRGWRRPPVLQRLRGRSRRPLFLCPPV